jgi:hypothetical protein
MEQERSVDAGICCSQSMNGYPGEYEWLIVSNYSALSLGSSGRLSFLKGAALSIFIFMMKKGLSIIRGYDNAGYMLRLT